MKANVFSAIQSTVRGVIQPYSGSNLIYVNNKTFLLGDGSTSSAVLLDNNGNPVETANLRSVTAVYKTDWQGTYLQSTSARTNLILQSQCSTGFLAQGTTPPTVTNSVTISGQSTTQVAFTTANTATGYAGCRATRVTTGYGASITSGQQYSLRIMVQLSRPLTGSESLILYWTGATGSRFVNIDASNSAGYVGAFAAVNDSVTATANGSLYPVVYLNHVVTSNLSVYFCAAECEQSTATGSYIPTTTSAATVTDYSISGATVNFGQVPLSGAVCSWSGTIFE